MVGRSPLWNSIVFSYENDLAACAGERGALVVVGGGIDSWIGEQTVPSKLRAGRLMQAAGEMDAQFYAIFLLAGERFGNNWSARARERIVALTWKPGGRLFRARSIAGTAPVLALLACEMRSACGIACYPANQHFDRN